MYSATEAKELSDSNKMKVVMKDYETLINEINRGISIAISVGKSEFRFFVPSLSHSSDTLELVENYYKDLGYDLTYGIGSGYCTIAYFRW